MTEILCLEVGEARNQAQAIEFGYGRATNGGLFLHGWIEYVRRMIVAVEVFRCYAIW